eukprot:scaffold5900_cov89-Skeletonema_dohrnii-CCMP3373.AAC.5
MHPPVMPLPASLRLVMPRDCLVMPRYPPPSFSSGIVRARQVGSRSRSKIGLSDGFASAEEITLSKYVGIQYQTLVRMEQRDVRLG